MARDRQKTQSTVDAGRVQMEMLARFNPIRGLKPQLLSHYLDMFELGWLRYLALTMRKIKERDDTLQALAPKREGAPARLDWEVVTREGAPAAAAEAQAEAVTHFFRNLECTSVIDLDERGGFPLLVRQMMLAIGYKYQVHEIVWKPLPTGLTAEFRSVPLWYFEHVTPRIRYLDQETQLYGSDLEGGGWLVTRGAGIMIACSILYMFKNLTWKDWLNYNQRFAIPGLHGTTPAAKGSDEWNNLKDALTNFGQDWVLLTNEGAKIEPVDVAGKGIAPHKELVERCDRAMAILWRGADLSTMSRGGGSVGASVQEKETEILFQDDCAMIEDALNRQIVPYIIQYATGGADVLVELRLSQPQKIETDKEIAVDTFLLGAGVPITKASLLDRYGRSTPPEDTLPEDLAVAPKMTAPADTQGDIPGVNSQVSPLANAAASGDPRAIVAALAHTRNERLRTAGRAAFAKALAHDLQPLRERIAQALQAPDAGLPHALAQLANNLPALLPNLAAGGQAERALEETLTAALFNGLAEATAARPKRPAKETKP